MDAMRLVEQAQAALQARDVAGARRLLAEAVRSDPRSEQAWLLLAAVLDDVDQAIECLQRVLALNPENSRARELMALAEQEKARRAAVAEIAAERTIAVGARPPAAEADDVPLAEPGDEDRPVPRLGRYLLDYKFITADQLRAALREQRRTQAAGQARRLGDILLEQGAISEERLNFALREQHRNFYSLFQD